MRPLRCARVGGHRVFLRVDVRIIEHVVHVARVVGERRAHHVVPAVPARRELGAAIVAADRGAQDCFVERGFEAMSSFYERTLDIVLRHQRITIGVFFATMALTAGVGRVDFVLCVKGLKDAGCAALLGLVKTTIPRDRLATSVVFLA